MQELSCHSPPSHVTDHLSSVAATNAEQCCSNITSHTLWQRMVNQLPIDSDSQTQHEPRMVELQVK
jgi:hypothetical protein